MAIDRIIAYHCAPVLSGIKPANIVTCDKAKIEDLHSRIAVLKDMLAGKNVRTEILYECEKYLLLMIYRPKQLEDYLNRAEVTEFLSDCGYGETYCPRKYFEILKRRIAQNCEFPHEIGIFLGYPLTDVKGFIENNGKNCKVCGAWKVYGNVNEACCIFRKIEKCQAVYAKHFDMGKSLLQLTVTI